MTSTDLQVLSSSLQDSFLPIVAGCATFGATLAMSTAAQKLVGVSTATKVLPTVYGAMTVCAASLMSEKSAIVAHQWQHNPHRIQNDFKQFKAKLWATSSNLKKQQSRPSNFFDHKQNDNNGRYLKRINSGDSLNTWFQLRQLPMHELRV
jgi:hypothetical protein